ncbi:hypothetical protein PIROE2DRAFT_13511 [Piromyces sp. E2]|nr:hypothetical protein PIROE2DRAFT_13511 [Piromyces sp. E2]|eukprot:OUM60654.1 hypothetical protein PIROE2DRAFT_13511 [Piromyces sp. E2]
MSFNEKLQSEELFNNTESEEKNNHHIQTEKIKKPPREFKHHIQQDKIYYKPSLPSLEHKNSNLQPSISSKKSSNIKETRTPESLSGIPKIKKSSIHSVINVRNAEYDNVIRKTKIKFNDKPKYQDLWAVLLFVMVVTTTVVLFITNIKYLFPSYFENIDSIHINTRTTNIFSNLHRDHNPIKTKVSNTNLKQNISYNDKNYIQNNSSIDIRDDNEKIFNSLTPTEFLYLMSFILIIPIVLSIIYIILLQK